MQSTITPTDPRLDEASRLYWESDETVESLVSRLGVSRHALYGALQPFPAGPACADCGEPLLYLNRSRRALGQAVCRTCASEVRLEPAGEVVPPARPVGLPGRVEESQRGRLGRWREELAAVPPARAAMIGGAAALGVLLGARATQALRER